MLAFISLAFVLKLALLAALSPIWWPILKALREEVDGALRAEGGLFGKPPTKADLERYEAEHGRYESGLLNEPYVRGQRPSRSGSSGGSARRGSSLQRSRGNRF